MRLPTPFFFLSPRSFPGLLLFPGLSLLAACQDEIVTEKEDEIVASGGLFTQGCPVGGQATARLLGADRERPEGPNALGKSGDVLLMSSRAAFVITAPERLQTYYAYGGIPVDAVALSGCEQAGPERFGEMGFIIGSLDVTDFNASNLHMFRGERIEVVNDGSDGGDAIVDVHGTDDNFWLIEMELQRRVLEDGGRKEMAAPWGLDVTVRYTLPPDGAVLSMEVILGSEEEADYLVGGVVFPSDYTTDQLSDTLGSGFDTLSFGGVSLVTSMPWFGLTSEEGSFAVAMPGATMARTKISGVTALIDVIEAATPMAVGPGVTASSEWLLAVGAGDLNTAVSELCPYLPEPLPGLGCTRRRVSGQVVDALGDPVEGATVAVEVEGTSGTWAAVDQLRTGRSGVFGGEAVDLGGLPMRLVASAEGRTDGEAVELADGPLTLSIGALGTLRYDIRDEMGTPLPAKVVLVETGEALYLMPGEDTAAVVPGTYTVSVTRGYEYEPVETTVEIPEGGEGTLSVTLDHVVDTTGWMSFDGHVHAELSPDAALLDVDRARSAAAVGLEIVVSSEHEAIGDIRDGIAAGGLGPFVNGLAGQEVTATSPEHTNAWPFEIDEEQARGSPVEWEGLSIGQIYAAERARGADVVVLNHPRIGCNYMCLIDWDRLTGEPSFDDPAALGLPTDQPLWDWGFDAVEYMNGPRDVFLDADDPLATGFLDDWLAFLNLGHRVTGLGTSDSHGMSDIGEPRTYYASPTDDPEAFAEADIVEAVLGGQAVVSAGAFATVSANGVGMGELASAPDGAVALVIRVQAPSVIDVTHVKVLVNCDEVADVPTDDPFGVVKLDTVVPLALTADAYVVVLGFGDELLPAGLAQYDGRVVPRVTTNAIYVDVDGNGVFDAPGGKACGYEVER